MTFSYHTVLAGLHLFPILGPSTLVYQAPHGKHADGSRFSLPGKLAWFTMEVISPLSLLAQLLWRSRRTTTEMTSTGLDAALPGPTVLLVVAYLLHYANRSTVSVLRSEGMADMGVLPWLSAIGFNLANGFLNGRYLSQAPVRDGSLRFWTGLAIWGLGWAGNLYHDEILLSVRRRSSNKDDDKDDISVTATSSSGKTRRYYVPQGGLYRYVSFPSYLCECIEWLGFALAAGGLFAPGLRWRGLPLLAPPALFALNIFAVLVPRAVTGHRWYRERFGRRYPAGRRAIIPGLL